MNHLKGVSISQMNYLLNIADKATKYGTAIVLALFALACLFSGCSFKEIPETSQMTEPTTETTSQISFLDMGEFKLTAYCACEICCKGSADGITATGTVPVQGRTIAVDQDVIPYGSEVMINGKTYIAEDCGGAIIGNRIDIYFDSHEEANEFGVQYGKVMLKVGDYT